MARVRRRGASAGVERGRQPRDFIAVDRHHVEPAGWQRAQPLQVALRGEHEATALARVDAGGSLRVGPESAGANPGPACYGRSLLPTVTDANLVLGRFGGAHLLGGSFELDEKRAKEALTILAREMSEASASKVSAERAALGVLRVVNVGMERALRVVSVERGYDPRSFSLVSFGGAGGLHAVELARALRIPRVIVPADPGALSATGALASDVLRDQSRTVMLDAHQKGARERLERAFRQMEREARRSLLREGFEESKQRHARSINARYRGQSFELEIEWLSGARLIERFHRAHEQRYGYAQSAGAVEIVSARLRSRGLVEKLKRKRAARIEDGGIVKAQKRARAYFDDGAREVGVYVREELNAGARLCTPCIVTEYSSTTLVPEGVSCRIDAHGNLIIEL